MQPLSFEVEDTFHFTARNWLVLVPGATEGQRVSTGDRILIIRPDGSTIHTDVRGVEMATPNPRRIHPIAVDFDQVGDVPVGSLVTAST